MTEAELLELACDYAQNAQGLFGLLLTVLFAYLATVHFVGNRSSVSQVLIVSVLFVWGAGILIVELQGALLRLGYIVSQLQQVLPDEKFFMTTRFTFAFTTLATLSIPVSLFFMYQIRRNPKPGAVRRQHELDGMG